MKQQKRNSITRNFYVGLVVILLCFVGSIWLVSQRQVALPMSDNTEEMVNEYIRWQYVKDWEKLIGATVKYYSGSLHEWASYTIEFEEAENYYTVNYAPRGGSVIMSCESPNVIGQHDGIDYVYMEFLYDLETKTASYFVLIDKNEEGAVYYPCDMYYVPSDADIRKKAEKTVQFFMSKINIIAEEQQRTMKPYIVIGITTLLVIFVWFFLVPPIESIQKNEKMKKIRYLGAGILAVTFGVWLSILGGIIAALIECRLENNLPQEDKAFCMKCVIPSLVINLCLGYLLLLLSTDQIIVGFLHGYRFLMDLSAIGVFFGYGAFGVTYGIKDERKCRKGRSEIVKVSDNSFDEQ